MMTANGTIGGQTVTYAVFGHPVAHTLSPAMHNPALQALGLNAVYTPYDVAPENLMEVLHACAKLGFGGINLTVPLKEVAFEGIEEIDPSAQAPGAVNTVEFVDGGLRGHNTDSYGFRTDFKAQFGADLSGQSICLLGTGGSARGVAIACVEAGVSALSVVGRRPERVNALVAEADEISDGQLEVVGAGFSESNWLALSRSADAVIHTTPMGMRDGEDSVAPPEAFCAGQAAYDLIYTSRETVFMQAAAQAGARSANGLGMLLHQGARSLEIWTGTSAPVDIMRQGLEEAVYARDNESNRDD